MIKISKNSEEFEILNVPNSKFVDYANHQMIYKNYSSMYSWFGEVANGHIINRIIPEDIK